ncbi:hypothetical protein JN27_16625 [Massilia sp. BSC265]|nr:hypothetical protein JN27_16625 [Massilia sp. BSC265]
MEFLSRQRNHQVNQPCAGIKGYQEVGRDVYVENEIYNLVWTCAGPKLRNAMDLTYLIGQQKADAFKVRLPDLKDSAVWVQQNKTKAAPPFV